MEADKALEIIQRLERLESGRINFDNLWQQCADYGMPNSNQIITKRSQGESKPDLFDSTAEDSNIELASGLYSYLFPTDSRAFILKIEDESLSENDEVSQGLERTTEIIHQQLIYSNFSEAFFEFLKSLGCFGAGCLYEEQGKNNPLVFTCFHVAGIYVAYNSDWEIDTVFRSFEYTARQAVQEFGKEHKDTLGEKVWKAYNDPKNMDKKFRFIHVVEPREDFDLSKDDPLSMQCASFYVNRDEKKGIYESGYPEMPYQINMFDKDPMEDWGRSPMMKMLPDIKMVNAMSKCKIKGREKQVDPVALLPDDGSIWPLTTKPGGVIYYRAGGDRPEFWEFKGDLNGLRQEILDTQQKIRKGFFCDRFDPLLDKRNMTAMEVMARIEQQIRFVTPTKGRIQSTLNRMIHRIIGILGRQNLLPEIITQLSQQGKSYKIQYLGKLALALQSLETEGLQKTLAQWTPMAEAQRTEWLDNLDMDVAFRDSMRNNGAPAKYLKEVDVRDKERQARAEQAQQQMMLEQAPELAKAAKNLSKPIEKGSPLEAIANGTV